MRKSINKILLIFSFRRHCLLERACDPPDRSPQNPGPPVTKRPRRILSLATATREYARRHDGGTLETARDADLAPLFEALGPSIWAWLYARRLTGQSPWRARPNVDERIERAIVAQQMHGDVDTWERAMVRLDVEVARARLYRTRIPDPLAVPDEVRAAIEQRRKLALERAERRHRRGDEGAGPAPVPDEAVAHVPFPSKQK